MVLWIFGYASLIWKAGFEYDDRVIGFIKGYKRSFHLACFEHRGTVELPARVATLEPDEEAICWGAAYCIKDAEAARRALAYLHVRECEYDTIKTVELFTENSPKTAVLSGVQVFMSTTGSRYFLGGAAKEEIALQIAVATGPSGPNCDYLFRLVEGLREIGHEDEEVIELATLVRKFRNELQVHGINCLRAYTKESTKFAAIVSALAQSSAAAVPPKLIAGVKISGLQSMSLNQLPCSPRLVKSRVLQLGR
ncbi:hypothetical protein GOP47_0022553 [Adiantum capillus-veneris]|uniref:Gamma-glutamylcyclotransferase n=1 Tax=Adiantum capillus-veneris TaxID=13818 RepID=A0A9D4U5K2_ADICA|nr:hypothetical protein GOP47_0022553 [Adiantum capillus-veneris]